MKPETSSLFSNRASAKLEKTTCAISSSASLFFQRKFNLKKGPDNYNVSFQQWQLHCLHVNSLTSVDYIALNENGPASTKIMDEPLMYSGPKEAALRTRNSATSWLQRAMYYLAGFHFYCAVHFTEYLVSQTSSRLGTGNCAIYKSQDLYYFYKSKSIHSIIQCQTYIYAE